MLYDTIQLQLYICNMYVACNYDKFLYIHNRTFEKNKGVKLNICQVFFTAYLRGIHYFFIDAFFIT